jgi:hypothetical protein
MFKVNLLVGSIDDWMVYWQMNLYLSWQLVVLVEVLHCLLFTATVFQGPVYYCHHLGYMPNTYPYWNCLYHHSSFVLHYVNYIVFQYIKMQH